MISHEQQEEMIASLISYFNKIEPLDKKEEELVFNLFKPRFYRKKQYVLQQGDVCNQFNFVVSGCLRMYRSDENADLHILQFATENWWMIDLGSFQNQSVSELNIEAIEDSMLLQINYANLEKLYRTAPKFNLIFRLLIENSFVSLQKRLLQNISSSAESRYLGFIIAYPHLVNRLPQVQIAAFLGISAEFLSRIRNKLSKSKS